MFAKGKDAYAVKFRNKELRMGTSLLEETGTIKKAEQ